MTRGLDSESHGQEPSLSGGVRSIKFGRLFEIYVRISNKLVGVLLRARKHGLVHFEGETLFQGRDDDVRVSLLRPSKDVRQEMNKSEDFKWGECM